ncbi:winged helix-turn-helix transcriptional regulator [Roseburia inulinivorans]
MPPKTEYSLTDFGRTLTPIIEAMQQWGQTHLNIAGCEERGATGTRYK